MGVVYYGTVVVDDDAPQDNAVDVEKFGSFTTIANYCYLAAFFFFNFRSFQRKFMFWLGYGSAIVGMLLFCIGTWTDEYGIDEWRYIVLTQAAATLFIICLLNA